MRKEFESKVRGLKRASILLVFLVAAACSHNTISFDEEKWRKDVENASIEKLYAPHFRDGKYFNPWMPQERKGFLQLLKWKLGQRASYTLKEKTFLPSFIPELKKRIQSGFSEDFIAWIGHSTFLLRLDGQYWLTDPIFTDRALLPKRVTPPAMFGDDIREIAPKVNVLISHNHYDHLDRESIRSLPETARIIVPKGLGEYISSFYRGIVIEMDWWDEMDEGNGTTLICLPAQHWSKRIGQSVNETLWASFIIVSPRNTIYYVGDSGYFIGYREFGRLFPKINYALISTTAYHPRWFMHYAHVNIAEALEAFSDLDACFFIPTQWGTFHLGEEPPGYPALDLKKTIRKKNLDPSRFIVMDIGQIEWISKSPP